MNNKHILDLTVRLSQALDQNYDVVNMDAVLSVISALEGATITKEQLEATRLAKYINQLRRRTKSEQLARRAKSLLKKWREMVVWQTNESANVSVQQHHHHHRSHPTSPTVLSSMEHGAGVVGKQPSVDFLRSTASNPATTSTGSATINLTSNKRQASVGGLNFSAVPSPAVPANGGSVSKGLIQPSSKDIGKQPTSFANLLIGVSNVGPPAISGSNIEDLLTSPSSRKSNKRKDRILPQPATKTFVIDQSSSSNTDFNRLSVQRNTLPMSNIASEVIDIQDSNSDSEVVSSTPMPATTTSNLGSSVIGSTTNISPKLKKSKKEKKRKGREQQQQTISSSMQNVPNIIEESCSNQLRPVVEQEFDKFVPIVDDRSRVVYPISGISEILSLSNSSMNSMFPNSTTPVTGSLAIEQTQTDLNVGINSSSQAKAKTLSTSDLTFAGKFKSAGSSDLFGGFNINRNDTSNSNTANAPAFAKASSSSHPFVPFNSSGGNSNDSTSNSRTSQFDIIDVVNQDNSQCKIIDELRQQHKKQVNDFSSTNTSIISQSQNKSLAAGSWSGQVLLPPKSTNNSLAFNTNVDSTVPSCEIEQKIPKKRGRKKGSKGVDSVIAKETSLCSQMLITTLGTKKVKTTKELYTEMQNRKLGISSTTSSPTLSNWLSHQQLSHMSRPNSSCSEPSLHSPRTSDACSTNATVSTVATRSTPDKTLCNNSIHGVLDEIDESYSDYNTSDPSRDSTTAHLSRRLSTDSNSNSHLVSKVNTLPNNNSLSIELIEKQIKELLSQLPPAQPLDKIMWECNDDVVPCTCVVTELATTVEELSLHKEIPNTDMADVLLSVKDLNKNEAESTEQQAVIVVRMEQLSTISEYVTKQLQNKNNTSELTLKKPKKSIFDLDFEEDEDPLQKFVAEAAAKQEQKVESIESLPNVKQEVSPESKTVNVAALNAEASVKTGPIVDQLTEFQPNIIFPTFEVNEDPNCLAKERYEIQTQKITQFHVTALHNCYIPNVNGNWDNAETSPTIASTLSKDSVDYKKIENLSGAINSSVDFCDNVVPQYGSLIAEYIPKDLSHINFTPNFKPRKRTSYEKRQHNVPFLGVAKRCLNLERLTYKSKKNGDLKNHIHDNCHKVKSASKYQTCLRSNESDVIPDSAVIIKNDSNDNVYIRDMVDEIIDDEDSKLEQEQQIKKEHTTGDNSYNLIVKDNLVGSNTNDIKTQAIISNKKVESNKVFSGITIDIEDDDVEVPQNMPTAKYTDSANNYLLTLAKLPDVVSYHSYENQNDQNINNNSAISSNSILYTEDKSTSNATPSTVIKNVDSRRSSSCSNSSLKQTQHSINLKLRRRRLQQQQQDEENKSSTSSPKLHRKRRRKSSKLIEDETAVDRKPRLIKRIKIAINGDIATQRQISIGSSNNSTDDDDEDDDDFLYSAGSRSSPIDYTADEYNVANEDCEEEEYIDDDDDEDDEEDDDYAGDFHEVVTRDISATSTGNNHIVLTIKKTPSKTNSPSDSLSAISPIIVPPLAVQPINNTVAEVTETKEKNTRASSGEVVSTSETLTACENYVADEEEYGSHKAKILNAFESNAEDIMSNTFQSNENSAENVIENPASLLSVSNKLKKPRLKRRRMKKVSSLSEHCTQKLHRQLFFPYELQASDFCGSILNISSCSSSCAEGSDYEYESATDSADAIKQNSKTILPSLPDKKFNSSSCSTCSNTRSSDLFFDTSDSKSSYTDNEAADGSLSDAEKLVKQEASVEVNKNFQTEKFLKSEKNHEVGAAIEDHLNEKEEVKESCESDMLSMKNNGLLKSFNNIYLTPEHVEQNHRMAAHTLNIADDEVEFSENVTNYVSDVYKENLKQEQWQQQKLPFENCDVYNNFYNNNNNSKLDNSNNSLKQMVRSSSNNSGSIIENIAGAASSNNNKTNNDTQKAQNALSPVSTAKQLIPQKEYRTGLRAVDEDVDDEDGNNCARIQQFKEWHQVLQLRSYNDEILTVLPYVVLD